LIKNWKVSIYRYIYIFFCLFWSFCFFFCFFIYWICILLHVHWHLVVISTKKSRFRNVRKMRNSDIWQFHEGLGCWTQINNTQTNQWWEEEKRRTETAPFLLKFMISSLH
jgi:predicted membrane protein